MASEGNPLLAFRLSPELGAIFRRMAAEAGGFAALIQHIVDGATASGPKATENLANEYGAGYVDGWDDGYDAGTLYQIRTFREQWLRAQAMNPGAAPRLRLPGWRVEAEERERLGELRARRSDAERGLRGAVG